MLLFRALLFAVVALATACGDTPGTTTSGGAPSEPQPVVKRTDKIDPAATALPMTKPKAEPVRTVAATPMTAGPQAYHRAVTFDGRDGEGYTYRVTLSFSVVNMRKEITDSAPGEARLGFSMPIKAEVTNTTPDRSAPITAVDVSVLVDRRMQGSCVQEHPNGDACPLFVNEATGKTASRTRSEIGPGQTVVLTARRVALEDGTFAEEDVDYVISHLADAVTGFSVSLSTGPTTVGSDGFSAHFDPAGEQVTRKG